MEGYIPEELITKILGSQDILDVISRYISLKKSGQNYKGLCPFHSEKTPSFVVSPAKQLFHCFGCGTGGNVITFLMKHEKSSFTDVARKLGQDAGIFIEGVTKDNKKENILYELNALAASFYHYKLMKTKEADSARGYLTKRGLTMDIIEKFNIGYSISSWDSTYDFLKKKGIHEDALLKSGLIIPRNNGKGYYDRFRSRIMFPIYDIQKRVTGFGGRVLDDSTPKYLNSPETPVFIKGNLLYGLDTARDSIKETGYAVIVEGYMDVIAAHQSGICNVVGTLGTAFTPAHLRLLQRICKEVILTFDSDTAGINAALRTLDVFIDSEVEARVLLLPEGEDPDSFIRKNGNAAFIELVSKAKGIVDFAIDRIIKKVTGVKGNLSLEVKVKNAEECLAIIRKIHNRIEQDHYLKKVSNDLNIDKDVLYAELKRRNTNKKAVHPEKMKNNSTLSHGGEEILLTLIIKDKGLRKLAKDNLDLMDFVNPGIRKSAAYILSSDKELHELLNTEVSDQDILSDITRLAVKDIHFDFPEKTLFDCIRVLRRERLNKELKELEQELSTAEIGGTFEKVRTLLLTKQSLLQRKKLLYEN